MGRPDDQHRNYTGEVPGLRDPRIRRRYTPEEEHRMESIRSARYRGDDPEYHHGGRPDEGLWSTMERMGSVAPVMGNPSIDPAAGDMVAVSYMAGYADDSPFGYDAMQGVDDMALGLVDAGRELNVDSAKEGGPLRLERTESAFSPRERGSRTHDISMEPERHSWTSELRMYEHEPESNCGGFTGDY